MGHHKDTKAPRGTGKGGGFVSSCLRGSKPKLVQTPLAIPQPLREWIDEEAGKLGMNRNAFLNYTLQLARQTQTIERLRRLETRVASLELWRQTVTIGA